MAGGRTKGSKQKRNESKYRLPDGVILKPGQPSDYIQTTPLQFIDSTYGEFTSTFRALLDAKASTHPNAVMSRRIATNLNKYGTNNAGATKESRKKAQDTLKSKYGKSHALQIDKFKKKLKSTLKRKYNKDVNSVLSIPEVQQKAQNTLNSKYNVTNAAKLIQTRILPNGKNIKEYCREKNVNSTMAYRIYKYYGPEQTQNWIDTHKQNISGLELTVQKSFPYLNRYEKVPKGVKNFRPDFECNGVFIDVDGLEYHSELHKTENQYHLRKREQFENAGYTLLQFRQDELILKTNIVNSIIKSKTNQTMDTYRASKLTIKKIDKNIADDFLNRTHLMGSSNGVTAYGLINPETNQVLSVVTVKIKNRELEIVRFSSELNVRIHGALSKFIKYIKVEYNGLFDRIIYFVDLRYGSGKSVLNLGFKLSGITLGWKWTDGFYTFNRLHCRANMDDRRLSEREYAKEMKLVKIYDAGQAKYILDIN